MFRISGQQIGNNLTKGPGKKAFIHMLDGKVYIFLAGGDSTLQISGGETHLDQFCGI
jgi:hypothetical protein